MDQVFNIEKSLNLLLANIVQNDRDTGFSI